LLMSWQLMKAKLNLFVIFAIQKCRRAKSSALQLAGDSLPFKGFNCWFDCQET
jgi:hypothetical protein